MMKFFLQWEAKMILIEWLSQFSLVEWSICLFLLATLSLNYSANTAIALDLSSLATSSTWIAGVESGQIDNTTNLYIDALVDVKGIVGHASTANTVGQELRIYVWGSDVSLNTTPISALDGTTSAETLTATVTQSLRQGASVQAIVTTAGLTFYVQPFSVAALFGGVMPKFWGLFVTHNFAGSLGASNNNLFQYTGVKLTT